MATGCFDGGALVRYVHSHMNLRRVCWTGRGASLAALMALSGCATSPFEDDNSASLRRSVIDATRRELADAERTPAPVVTRRDNAMADLGLEPSRMPELEKMGGPRSYDLSRVPLGNNLMGETTQTVMVSLERLVRTAVDHNIAVQFARLSPPISEAQVLAAEAAFDWVLFSNINYQNTDSPRAATSATGGTNNITTDEFQTVSGQFGIRRSLVGGGRLTVQNDVSYSDNDTRNQTVRPNPAQQTSLTVQWDQPLLRGLGSEVTQAEVRVARNAERNAVQTLRRDLIRVVSDVERTYWELVRSHLDVLILERLFERGLKVRDQLVERARVVGDANRAQVAEARARVEERRANLLQAQTQLRIVSDRLKALVNDPELPVGSEVVMVPANMPADEPVQFSLLESIRTSIQNRPEVVQAVLGIDDASIRQVVARNALLPDLNLRLQTRFSQLDDNLGESYGSLFNGNFVDYLVGLQFEYPLGNRRAEADYRRRYLERMQTTLAYRNSVQQVVGEVTQSLRRTVLNYALIEQRAASRLAAAESLRVLLVEKDISEGYTVERLDLELNQEERLSQAERAEIQALVDYNTAIADLFAAMGTALERNNIRFIVPTVDDVPGRREPAKEE